MSRLGGVAHQKDKGRLPGGIAADFSQLEEAFGGSTLHALMVHHLHSFVAGTSSNAASCYKQVCPLPDTACPQTLRPIIAIAHGNEANQRGCEHPVGVAGLRTLRRD